MEKRVPVVWGYDFSEVIGSATIAEDGTVTFTIIDPRIIEMVKTADARAIEAISLSHKPASKMEPNPGPSFVHDFYCTHNPCQCSGKGEIGKRIN